MTTANMMKRKAEEEADPAATGRKQARREDVAEGQPPSKQQRLSEDGGVRSIFSNLRAELDAHHDFNEHLVRFSRDVTADSKKLIFLLHRYNPALPAEHESNQKLMEEAQAKADEIFSYIRQTVSKNRLGPVSKPPVSVDEMQAIAKAEHPEQHAEKKEAPKTEERGKGPRGFKKEQGPLMLPPMSTAGRYADRYERAFGPGLEEYIEGISFLHYLKTRRLLSFSELEESFRDAQQKDDASVIFAVPPRRYLLGISDLSGELMRFATNAVGAGDITGEIAVADVLATLRHIKSSLDAFVPLVGRELIKKQSVTEASVRKIEDILYALRIRTSEFGDNPEAMKALAQRALSSGAPQQQQGQGDDGNDGD